MPDKWDQYAVPSSPAPVATPPPAQDKWSQYAQPAQASTPSLTPVPSTPPPATSGEGTYGMKSPSGQLEQIPYSKVHNSIQGGYLFNDKPTLQQYARDLDADPMHEDKVDQFLDNHPWIGSPVSALLGMGTGALKTVTAFDKTPTSRAETELQLAAAKPTHGVAQHLGEAAENIAEFEAGGGAGKAVSNIAERFATPELMGMLGRAAASLPIADRLKKMTALATTLNENPVLAKLAKIGSTVVKQGTLEQAAKQGTIGAAQTYVKSGGDTGAAITSGAETALTAGALQGLQAGGAAVKAAHEGVPEAPTVFQEIGGTKVPVGKGAETAARSAEAYSEQSRAVIKDTLDKLNVHPDTAQRVLDTTHDLTGAKERMQSEVLNPIYDNLDKLTGSKFRPLNKEVQTAKFAARSGGPEAQANYQKKLSEMNDLLERETGGLPKDYLDRVKSAWTQWNILDDISSRMDKNISGVPGASTASTVPRGVNGKGMMTSLSGAVKTYGRQAIEDTLGKGRLENFEEIARLNQTPKQQAVFNQGIEAVAENLPKGKFQLSGLGKRTGAAFLGGTIAYAAGAPTYYGMAAGEAAYEVQAAVRKAVMNNPKIGQNFMFALKSGASAARYGPYIAGLITKMNAESSREEQANAKQAR